MTKLFVQSAQTVSFTFTDPIKLYTYSYYQFNYSIEKVTVLLKEYG